MSGVLALELSGGAQVLFTERTDGSLSSVGGDGAEQAESARARLLERIGPRAIARGHQVHGAVVERVRRPPPAGPGRGTGREADGQATALAGVATMVLTADCLPVALAGEGAVAMLHAGWRGLAAGVLEEGLRAIEQLGGGGEIVAVIGPGAGACCYEVGPEVHAAFGEQRTQAGPIDLREIARRRLLAAGASEVLELGGCTICDERFFSHRREGARAGRQAGLIWRG